MTTHCGYIALIGRPNVGKSTLLNRLLKQKLSITSRKPQTTRHSIVGVHTLGEMQFVYVDTPGLHQGIKKQMNKMMNKAAIRVLNDVDVVVWIVESLHWTEDDDYVLKLLEKTETPVILVVNKVDKVADKARLLPFIENTAKKHRFDNVIPLSAKSGKQVDELEKTLAAYLPEGPQLFPEDQITDRSVRFLCAERVREKIFRMYGHELPYSTTIDIERFEEKPKITHIDVLILVEKESHKRMIIGEGGQKLKLVATQAREEIEDLIGKKVFMRCWCKVKSGWSDDVRALRQLGYE